MARSLRVLLVFAVTLGALALPGMTPSATAAELDKKGKADAKEAMRLYKEGNYEDAAKVFARLSITYPDMLVFVRNLGACYYYLRRWEPAISNLRDYEHRKKDIAADDHAEIAGWIGEMERLRDMATAPATAIPAPTPPPAAPTPERAPPVAPAATVPAPASPSAPPAPAATPEGTSPASSEPSAASQTTEGQPYPPAQWGAQSSYPPGPYGAQPAYPQTQYQYGAPSTYPYPGTPGAYPQGYPPGAYGPAAPAGQVAAAPQGRGTGRKVAAWILGITGVSGIVVGAVCTVKALDDFSKVQKKYDPALESEGKKFAVAQWVGYGVGGALLVTAIIVGSGGSSSSRVALAPSVGPGTAGATLAGTF